MNYLVISVFLPRLQLLHDFITKIVFYSVMKITTSISLDQDTLPSCLCCTIFRTCIFCFKYILFNIFLIISNVYL